MANRQKNDGYNNQYKKPMDKSKYKTWPCDKGYKCPYRRVDQDGSIVKIYCTFIHYPYDLCPQKQDCEFFQTEDCVWKHTTKPKPKPAPIVQVKPPVTQIIQDQSQFPSIGNNPINKPASKPSTGTQNIKNQQHTANKSPSPCQNNNVNYNINANSLNPNNNNNNFSPTINGEYDHNNAKNFNPDNKKLDKKQKSPDNSHDNNPQSNSYVNVNITPYIPTLVKQQRYQASFQPSAKIEQRYQNKEEQEKSQNSYLISPQMTQKFNLQKQSLQPNGSNLRINQPKKQMISEGSQQYQVQRSQKYNKEQSQIQKYSPSNIVNNQIQGQKQVDITREIEKLAKQVLKYNIDKNELEEGDYENNIKLSQILNLSNHLRKLLMTYSILQAQITSQILPNNDKNPPAPVLNNETNQSYQNYHQYQNSIENPQEQKYVQTNQVSGQLKFDQPASRKNSTKMNQQVKPEYKNDKKKFNKRVILSLEQINQLSVDTKNVAISQFLLNVFLDFITDKQHIEFKFQVNKKKFEIVQKFYDQDYKKYHNHQRYSFYSTEVLQQSHFEQLCQTIKKNSCAPKSNHSVYQQPINQKLSSFIKPQNEMFNEQSPQNVIKQFFWHFFEYLQFYFKTIKQDFKDKTLQVLDLFYKFIILPHDIIPANSPEVSIQDPNHFKGPIYVGGLRNVCMRFFAKIYLLFLQNNLYATMKLKQQMKNRIPSFDSKKITKFMQEKHEQTLKKLTGNQYKDNIECNKKKRPMDRQLIDSEVKDKLALEMMVRSHPLIDQIMLGQKDTVLSWQSMKEYIELKTHEQIFTDQIPETQVDVGKIEMIKIICKGQIQIDESDRKKYNQKEKNRFSFLESYFMQHATEQEILQQHNQFIANKTIQIGQKSYVTLLSDGKYIIEQPFVEHRIQQHQNQISTKVRQKNSKARNPPYHQTKIFYYAKAKTHLSTCPLELIAKDLFFNNKILNVTQDSPYIVYCNSENGFYGPDSVDSFKIRIHRQGGIIEFLNAKDQQQCKRYFRFIIDTIIRHNQYELELLNKSLYDTMHSNKSRQSKLQISNNVPQPSYFLLTIKPDEKNVLPGNDKSQITKFLSMQPKQRPILKYKKQSLSIVTWNLKRVFESDLIHRQISKTLRCKNIINDLKALKADIICLQEVKDFKKQLYEQLCQDNQLYFMPLHEDIDDFETLIMTRFPVKYSTVKIASQKWACCEFQIETWVPSKDPTTNNQKMNEFEEQKQNDKSKQAKQLSVLVMSVHLKCTEMESQDSFLSSTQTRERQLKNMEEFFSLNEVEKKKKYDLVIMGGDFNIDDEPSQYKVGGETVKEINHNEKYLKYPSYFDLQAQLHPETLQTCKTYLHKGLMENNKYRLGGSRIDRILMRSHSSVNIEDIITGLRDFCLVGNYSLISKQNASEVNYDKFTRSPSDHFGVYMEILFNL